MNENLTKLESLIDPEVMAPMISGKLEKAIVATPFAKIDNTLEGQPGSTITVPKYEYIGDAEDVDTMLNMVLVPYIKQLYLAYELMQKHHF